MFSLKAALIFVLRTLCFWMVLFFFGSQPLKKTKQKTSKKKPNPSTPGPKSPFGPVQLLCWILLFSWRCHACEGWRRWQHVIGSCSLMQAALIQMLSCSPFHLQSPGQAVQLPGGFIWFWWASCQQRVGACSTLTPEPVICKTFQRFVFSPVTHFMYSIPNERLGQFVIIVFLQLCCTLTLHPHLFCLKMLKRISLYSKPSRF